MRLLPQIALDAPLEPLRTTRTTRSSCRRIRGNVAPSAADRMYYIIKPGPPQAILAATRAGSVTVRDHSVTYNAGAWLVFVSQRAEAPLSDLEVTAFATVDSSETLARAQLVSFTLQSALGSEPLGLQA